MENQLSTEAVKIGLCRLLTNFGSHCLAPSTIMGKSSNPYASKSQNGKKPPPSAGSPKRIIKRPSKEDSPQSVATANAKFTKPKHNQIFVVGLIGGFWVAWVKNRAYTDEFPAYTRDIVAQLKDEESGEAIMELAKITFLASRADVENPNVARLYYRHDENGKLREETEPMIVFVRVLDDPSQNTHEFRQKWGENLATIFTKLSTFRRTYAFYEDVQANLTEVTQHIGLFITAREAVFAGQFVHNELSLSEILESDSIMEELFGSATRVAAARAHLRAEIQGGQQQAGGLGNLELHQL